MQNWVVIPLSDNKEYTDSKSDSDSHYQILHNMCSKIRQYFLLMDNNQYIENELILNKGQN